MKQFPGWLVLANDTVAVVLALSANFTLLYLIHCHTPKYLRPYAQILRIHCLADICCDLMLALIGPQVCPFNHRLHYLNSGIWKASGPEEWMQMIKIFVLLSVFAPTFLMSMDFVFRWLLICRNYQMSKLQQSAFALISYLLAALLGYPFFGPITRTDPALMTNAEIEYFKQTMETDAVPTLGIIATVSPTIRRSIVQNEPLLVTVICTFDAAVFTEYCLIFYFIREIARKTANDTKRSPNPKAAAARNRSITRIMLLQAYFPMEGQRMFQAALPLLTLLSASINITASMLGVDAPLLGAACTQSLAWLAVCRPLATVLITPHYRECIQRWLGIRPNPKEPKSSAEFGGDLNYTVPL